LSPCESWLFGRTGTLYGFDRAKKKITRTLHGHRGSVTVLSVAPDRRTFASGGSDTTIVIWDATKVK
jgi:WD40 repeat protein